MPLRISQAMTDTVVTSALARKIQMLEDYTGIYRDYEKHHIATVRICRLIRTDLFCDFSHLKNFLQPNFVLDLAYEGGRSSLNDRL